MDIGRIHVRVRSVSCSLNFGRPLLRNAIYKKTMKRLTILVIMLVSAVTVARSESENSASPVGKVKTTVLLPVFQVRAPNAPCPLPVKLEVPVPGAESLIIRSESSRIILVSQARVSRSKA